MKGSIAVNTSSITNYLLTQDNHTKEKNLQINNIKIIIKPMRSVIANLYLHKNFSNLFNG